MVTGATWLHVSNMPGPLDSNASGGPAGIDRDADPVDMVLVSAGALRKLLARAAIGVGIEHLGGETVSANAVLAERLGYTIEELREIRFWDYTHPRDRDKDRGLFEDLVDGRLGSFTIEKQYLGKAGRTAWGRLTRTLVEGSDGTTYALGIWQDISERKAAEEALQESEARYRNFAECASDWFFELDAAGAFTHVSDGFRRSTGYPADYIVGRTLQQLAEHETGEPGEGLEAIRMHRPFRKAELALRHADGALRWIQISGNPRFDGKGTFVGYQGAATDITERVAAEQALRESRDLYGSVVATTPVGICIHQDGRFVFANPEVVRILGALDASEIIGRDIWDFVAEDSRETLHRTVEERYRRGCESRVEVNFMRADGQVIRVRSTGRVVAFNGRPAMQVVLEDVTREREVLSALEQSEARLRAIVDASPIGIFLKDQDGRFVLANAAICEFWGVSEQQILGHRSVDFQAPDLVERSLAGDEALRGGATTFGGDFDRVESDGSRRFFTDVKFPIRSRDDEFLGIGGVVVETTASRRTEEARRASEAIFRALVENIPASVIVKDLAGRYLAVNRRFEAWHGSLDQRRIRTLHDIYPPEDAARIEAVDREVLRSGGPVEYEQTIPLTDGSTITALVTKFPIADADGGISMIGAISTDISGRKRFEEDLRLAKEAAEVASHAKTQFLANMSHELRTPLNSIIGFSEMMASEVFGKLGHQKYNEYVSDVLASGRSLLDLISDILDISRVEAGGMTLNEEWVEVAPLLKDSLRIIETRARSAGLELVLDVAAPLPMLYADERRVRQILINLLSNAVKFTPRGGSVAARARLDREGRLVFEVADSGIGIPEDKLEVAMAVFGQIEDPLTRSREGAGLGLPLSRGLAELHGASLEIESRVGAGTTARVVFPSQRTKASVCRSPCVR